MKKHNNSRVLSFLALACLVVPMFGSYFFDDIFSTLSHLFSHPECLELGWNTSDYGFYAGGYSLLCIFGGLIIGGILLDMFGVRIIGSIFVGMMVLGGATIAIALTGGFTPKMSLWIAYAGRTLFGFGSEIAGVAVTQSIAKWFKYGNMSLAMGLQLAIARLGTAAALIISPLMVSTKPQGQIYTLMETARPALAGLVLLGIGAALWFVFVRMDAVYDKRQSCIRTDKPTDEKFKFSDIGRLLTDKRFILISLLCVFFYCCVVSFKKFGSAILVPRFDMEADKVKWMISMIPFSTVVFTPLFGAMVDRFGKAERWMFIGAVLVFAAHITIALAPQGQPLWGYAALAMLGIGYSLVPSAMWPSVPRIVDERNLGTAYSVIYWVQNMGLMITPMIVGKILTGTESSVNAEFVFIALGALAIATASVLWKIRAGAPGRSVTEQHN